MSERYMGCNCKKCNGYLMYTEALGTFVCDKCGTKHYQAGEYTVVTDEYIQDNLVIENGVLTAFKQDMTTLRPWDHFKTAYIPAQVKVIGSTAFQNCPDVEAIELAEGVEEIADEAFAGHGQFVKFTLPSTLKKIGKRAFMGTSIIKLTLPEGLEEIGEEAFKDCIRMYKNVIPSTVRKVGKNAFDGCYRLGSLRLRATEVPETWDKDFKGNGDLGVLCNSPSFEDTYQEDAHYDEFEELVYVTSVDKELVADCNQAANISWLEVTYNVNKIMPNAFEKNNRLVTVVINDYGSRSPIYTKGVREIGEGAFRGCKNLKNLTIVYGVEKIGKEAFADTGVEYLDIPNTVKEIGEGAFRNCKKLKKVFLEPGLTATISKEMFRGCEALEEVIIPDGVKRVEYGAFMECKELKKIKFPKTVDNVGESVLLVCPALKEANLPENLTEIPKATFFGCESLKTVQIPDSVTTIGDSAFWYCEGLQELRLPAGIKKIEQYGFADCKSLANIELPDGLETLGYACFLRNTGLTRLYIPASVTYIGEDVCEGCDSLKVIETGHSSAPKTFHKNWLANGQKKVLFLTLTKKHKVRYGVTK